MLYFNGKTEVNKNSWRPPDKEKQTTDPANFAPSLFMVRVCVRKQTFCPHPSTLLVLSCSSVMWWQNWFITVSVKKQPRELPLGLFSRRIVVTYKKWLPSLPHGTAAGSHCIVSWLFGVCFSSLLPRRSWTFTLRNSCDSHSTTFSSLHCWFSRSDEWLQMMRTDPLEKFWQRQRRRLRLGQQTRLRGRLSCRALQEKRIVVVYSMSIPWHFRHGSSAIRLSNSKQKNLLNNMNARNPISSP